MTTTGQLVAFCGVVGLGAMSPGPDFAVVVRRSALRGRAEGMAAATGVATGVFLWAVAAAAGVAALVATVPVVLTSIRYAGAAYLAYLGVRALLAAVRPAVAGPVAEPGSAGGAFRDGLLCNALNPKAAVFFLALLPQFLPAHPGAADTLTLSLLAVGITLLWFCTVANLVAVFRRLFARSRVRRTLDGLSGAALLALGARLALVRP
ncbi:LysE family translocator [Amorphoplanes nipponensis]|uniref:Threonine transporter n=1 Tax=Actinoplanes nipponensis TaxID=135950 RepID=A0A919MVL0_9ACTN|nr:LysE family translocator [Actinoplanes nipponensis]GIE51275.1 threonine transporter [Actinoplanes nipponensis]